MIISGYTDEISQDLTVALDVLAREQIQHVDLRRIWGRNVTLLDEEQVRDAQAQIAQRGFTVTAISTAVGKTQITDDFAPEVARFQRALELARLFDAPYVRVFSFYVSEEEAARYRPEALRRLRHLCELADDVGVVLIHENEEGGFCAWRPEECLAFHRELPENFRACFEPCSFTVMGYDAYREALPLLQPYIAYWHVRDTTRGTTRYTVVGEGDTGWPQLLTSLRQNGYQGYLALEPHLEWDNPRATDQDRISSFQRAAAALRNALADLNAA
jgi:sugar phosphate isomerase/epimerase